MTIDDRRTMPFEPIRPPPLPLSQRPPEPQYMYATRREDKDSTMARNISLVLVALITATGGGVYYMQPAKAAPAPQIVHHQPHASSIDTTAIVLIKHQLDALDTKVDKMDERQRTIERTVIRIEANQGRRR